MARVGGPKQRWIAEEVASLKAGVRKHGVGKWRTILTDPEFGQTLRFRSNVDLKDKWRNINVMENGTRSRNKARLAIRKSRSASKHENNSMTRTTVPQAEEGTPLSSAVEALQNSGSIESLARLDKLIQEAITKSGSPNGPGKSEISMYIEDIRQIWLKTQLKHDQYWTPPNFKTVLSAKMKDMVGTGKLIKEKCKYRIAPSGSISAVKRTSPLSLFEGKQQDSFVSENNRVDNMFSKSPIDIELSKMRSMTGQEAGAVAIRAILEAEVAIVVAEKAIREAQAAEAQAETAQEFAQAAVRALECTANYVCFF